MMCFFFFFFCCVCLWCLCVVFVSFLHVLLLKKKKKKFARPFFVVFCFFFFSCWKSCMGFFFISSQIYTHTHKVVTECVINTLSSQWVYIRIYIYITRFGNQIWICLFRKSGRTFCAWERDSLLLLLSFLFFFRRKLGEEIGIILDLYTRERERNNNRGGQRRKE